LLACGDPGQCGADHAGHDRDVEVPELAGLDADAQRADVVQLGLVVPGAVALLGGEDGGQVPRVRGVELDAAADEREQADSLLRSGATLGGSRWRRLLKQSCSE
jgi:hypothetical protein